MPTLPEIELWSSSFLLINLPLLSFHVLMTLNMKITVFWDIAPCSLIEVDMFQMFILPP
jgi:hypothetical protein